MRFLYFSDWHGRITPPENRLDDYEQTMTNKLIEVLDIGEKYQVDAYLDGGDFWDAPNAPLDYVAKIMNLWKSKTNKKKIGIVGNHEEYANNVKSIPKTVAGFTGNISDYIVYVSKENPYIFTDKSGYTVAISGVDYHLDMDMPEHLDDYIIDEKKGDIQIHLTHGMLKNKSLGDLITHTSIDQITNTKADITLSGHDHIGFPITEVDGKYFCNPGGLARVSNNIKEINRKPKVLLIDIDENKKITLKNIYLKSALRGEDVLDRSVIESKKEKDEKIAQFKSSVKIAKEKKSTDILEIIKTIGSEKSIDNDIIDNIIDEITKKVVEMGSSLNKGSSSENILIEKIILENFQSHEHTIIDCSENFNIFIGESGQGKSSVLRALAFVYENKGKVKRLITRGKRNVRVTLVLNNGYKVSRYAELKGKTGTDVGKNGYEVFNPNTQEPEFFNTKALPDIQEILGYSTLKLDKDLEVSVNFMKQGVGWFLISDNYTAPQRAKIIGGIYGTQFADGVIRNIETEEKQIKKKSDTLEKDVEKINNQLQEFNYLDDYNAKINEVKDYLNQLRQLEEESNEIKDLIAKKEQLSKKISEINNVISVTEDIDINIKESLNKLRDLNAKKKRIESISLKIEKIDKDVKKEKNILSQENNVTLALQEVSKLKSLSKNRDKGEDIIAKIKEYNSDKTKISTWLKNIENTLTITESIEDLKGSFTKIKEIREKRNLVIDVCNKRNAVNLSIKKEKDIITQNTKLLNTQVEEYKVLLRKIGKCPVCLSPIDNVSIERIMLKILAK